MRLNKVWGVSAFDNVSLSVCLHSQSSVYLPGLNLNCVSPEFLDNVDVAEIDGSGGGGVDDLHDGVDAHGREQAGVL